MVQQLNSSAAQDMQLCADLPHFENAWADLSPLHILAHSAGVSTSCSVRWGLMQKHLSENRTIIYRDS